MKRISQKSFGKRGAYSLVFMIASAMTAIGCGWSLLTEHSVRFNAYRSGRGFYRLPPLPIMYEPKTGKEISVESLNDFYESAEDAGDSISANESEKSESESSTVWDDARTAVQANELDKARTLLEKFLELTKIAQFEAVDHERRNSARDMLDALGALKQGSKIDPVRIYLEARYAAFHNTGESPDGFSKSFADKNLQDNWEYFYAALLVREKNPAGALSAFEVHAENYPTSEKHQAVLYMIAKLTMESSHSFGNTACGIQGESAKEEDSNASEAEPIENCRDAAWLKALGDFKSLMHQYPNGRYFNDARGWLAYLYRRGGNRAEALAEYYRMLGHPNDWSVRLEAKKSLQMVGRVYDDATLEKVESLIADDPNAAMAYAYHRIYNHAIDLTYVERRSWCCYGENAWRQEEEEKTRVETAHRDGTHVLDRVATFATSMLKRHPNERVSGGFVLRIAEAQLELQKYNEALTLSRKAIALSVAGDERAEALWIKGSSEHGLTDFASARGTFTQLIDEFPKSKLTEGARRLLAMSAEDEDDLESALEQYLALDYENDIAYFLDVLMPTERLARFVEAHKADTYHNRFLYSLGVRYMREKKWDDARAAFRKVVTVDSSPEPDRDSSTDQTKIAFAKSPDGYIGVTDKKIRTSWVMQDVKTIEVLENFERASMNAPDDEARAEAMYQAASFQFDGDDLLFYNPSLWAGGRFMLLSELQDNNGMRQSSERQILFDQSQSHETLARAIIGYLEIVNRYPNTRAAKDAMYTAAVAHEKLSNLNNYWRDIYERGMFAGSRYVTYSDVKSAYPRYQLPRGTDGWQASSRTVNGGPGWSAPAKPLPRETREHKVKRLLTEFGDYVSTKFTTGVWPKVESQIDAGIDWYGSMIEAAVYGVLCAIGAWILILVGIGLHSERLRDQLLPSTKEPYSADSHVDKFIE